MANSTKGNSLRLYLRDEDLKALSALTEALEISQTEVMSRIMTAGIRALAEQGNRMPLPLRFEVAVEPAGATRSVKPETKARR